MYKHLMIDLETLGTKSFSCILSIGAVEFNINTGHTGKEFYEIIDLQSCLDLGLTVDASTILWWMEQDPIVKKTLINSNNLPIKIVLENFSVFCESMDYEIWGNSAKFDCGILQNAYNKVNIPIPWNYKKERCVKTLSSLAPEIKANIEFIGVKHNPIDDCIHQIKYCTAIYNKLIK